MGLVFRAKINTVGRDFVVGDIHGCYDKLLAALDDIGFDRKADRLFAVGDLVDRGHQNEQVVELLREPWFFSVRGNHDQMLLDAVNNPDDDFYTIHHVQNGGAWYYGLPTDQKQEIAALLGSLPVAIEVMTKYGTIGVVHAQVLGNDWNAMVDSIESGGNAGKYATQVALWSRQKVLSSDNSKVRGVHHVYVGHTVVNFPTILGNVTYTDTGAVFNHDITIMQIN